MHYKIEKLKIEHFVTSSKTHLRRGVPTSIFLINLEKGYVTFAICSYVLLPFVFVESMLKYSSRVGPNCLNISAT